MRKLMVIVFIFFVFPAATFSAPSVSGISGTITDGQSITISGTGFGAAPPTIEWTGDNIEAGSEGGYFSKTNWRNAAFPERGRYDNARAWSGNQSIVFDSTGGDGRFGLVYNTGSSITEVYATWMAYIDVGGQGTGQWKMFRIEPIDTIEDGSDPDLRLFNGWNWNGYQVVVGTTDGDTSYSASAYPRGGAWYRIEFYGVPSTAGSANGTVQISLSTPGTSFESVYNNTSVMTYASGEALQWQYVAFHNYQGNGFEGHSVVWNDDIYISNSRARVEVGNASTFSSCTWREIQPITSHADEYITVTINQGGMSSLDGAYLFVIDAEGVPSAGWALTQTPTPEAISTGAMPPLSVIGIIKDWVN